jgi:predicted dehydrogenase
LFILAFAVVMNEVETGNHLLTHEIGFIILSQRKNKFLSVVFPPFPGEIEGNVRMAARKLKVAVVGASISNSPDGREHWAVRGHLPALKELPDLFETVAVCTTRMETATAAAQRFAVPHAFDSVERMLKELPEIDVVCVSVRPSVHHQVAMAALNAGKHVYCEHPFGISTAQAREMYELGRRKGVSTIVGHEHHYEPAVLQMAELIREGYIGNPLTFNIAHFAANYITPRPSHRGWLFQSEIGGHPAYRSGHSLEHLTSVLGLDINEICADMAVQVPEPPTIDGGVPIVSDQVDNMNYLIRAGGAMGNLLVSFTAWFSTGRRFEIYGTEGMLMLDTADRAGGDKKTAQGGRTGSGLKLYGARADLREMMKNPVAPERLERRFAEIPLADRHCYVKGIERGRVFLVAQTWHAFADAIQAGRDGVPSFRDELKIHCVWDAAERSVREKRWVKVDYSPVG